MVSYTKFLDGKIWDDCFLKVDYDNVTVSFTDNFQEAKYATHDYSYNDKVIHKNMATYHHISFRSSNRKYFTIDAPFFEDQLLIYFRVNINEGIFPDGKKHSIFDSN